MAWEIRSWAERLVRSLAMIGTRITAAKNPKKIAGIKISGSIVRSMLRLGFCPIADTDAPGPGFGRRASGTKTPEKRKTPPEGRALEVTRGGIWPSGADRDAVGRGEQLLQQTPAL